MASVRRDGETIDNSCGEPSGRNAGDKLRSTTYAAVPDSGAVTLDPVYEQTFPERNICVRHGVM